MIAWEALFGGGSEATLRVSSAIARLVCAPGLERRQLRKRVADIYGLRSKVVHGTFVDEREVSAASRQAIRLTVTLLRTLFKDRPDLVAMTSGERSTQLLLE